eukprot:289033-Prymnesium_polylepis.1
MALGGTGSPHQVGSWRYLVWILVTSREFSALIFSLVVINCIMMSVDVQSAKYFNDDLGSTLESFDSFFVIAFSFEAILKLYALGPFAVPNGYFRSPWHCMDFLIVICGLISMGIPDLDGITAIRALRALRAMSVFSSFRDVLGAFSGSLYQLTTIFSLFVVFSLVIGVIGVQVFGGVLAHHCMAGGEMLDTQDQVRAPPPPPRRRLWLFGAPLAQR